MCLLLETIKLQNGVLENLCYHNLRMNAAREELFRTAGSIRIEEEIRIPPEFMAGVFRCRIFYKRSIEQVEFLPHASRIFNRLKIVHHDSIDYHLKFADRTLLNELFAFRGKADEIIIIKNGLVTDCTIGNLVFYDGKEWVTPDTPLLKGTRRQALLEQHRIRERQITASDLPRFDRTGIINSFYDLDDMPVILQQNIFT